MPEYENIGQGGMWINEGKTGNKYISGSLEFDYQGHPVMVRFVAFKNEKKVEGSKQPDYQIKVGSWEHAKAREVKLPPAGKETTKDEGVPF